MENKEKRMIGEYTSHLLMRGEKVLTEPISKELNGVTYTVNPNSTVLAIDRDPYQGALEVYCVIGMYEDASEAGPAMVFYSNNGEICYGVKLNHYLNETLDSIYYTLFNSEYGVCNSTINNAVYSVVSNQEGVTLTNHSDSELNFTFYIQNGSVNIEVKSGEVVEFTKSPIAYMMFDAFEATPHFSRSDDSEKFSVNGDNLNIAKRSTEQRLGHGVEYEINGTKGFFVSMNIECQGKEAVRKRLAELYGCDVRNMLFKDNSSDEPLWML